MLENYFMPKVNSFDLYKSYNVHIFCKKYNKNNNSNKKFISISIFI